MWIAHALIIHLAFLGSIFVVYFRSPIITGLQAQQQITSGNEISPPAKRLVLFVTDGLRAESFFRNNCKDVPHIRSLMQQHGLVGISHTRVPTESRPGHIALIAGFYEDPSAVTRGWKENPIEFDSVFNRSRKTYAWGAKDILHLFNKLTVAKEGHLYFEAYDHELDFSGQANTYDLDEWVFERAEKFLKSRGAELRNERQIVFFLHLLGLDTAGHIHKPGSELFLENLHRTEKKIFEIYHEFEKVFNDFATAYILTSDHGMTNSGAHGAGNAHETETPFFLWGAGVRQGLETTGRTFNAGEKILPLHEIEQAQIAPLMSALLGLPPPINNFGKLPLHLLNVSREYGARAAYSNSLQLLEQFSHSLREHKRGTLSKYLQQFDKLDERRVMEFMSAIDQLMENQDFKAIIERSYAIMDEALEGIDYYHNYYQNSLLLATTLSFLGWMYYLMQLLYESHVKSFKTWRLPWTSCGLAAFALAICILQHIPVAVTFYILLPIMVWSLPAGKGFMTWSTLTQILPLKKLIPIVIFAELVVFTFFERKAISFCYVLYGVMSAWQRRSLATRFELAFRIAFIIVVAAFPLLPPCVGYSNWKLVFLGMSLTFARNFLIKSRLKLAQICIPAICMLNGAFCIYKHSQQDPVPLVSLMISWGFVAYAIAAMLLSESLLIGHRIELIFFNCFSFYALLCTSYELIFILFLASELLFVQSLSPAKSFNQVYAKGNSVCRIGESVEISLRYACLVLLYCFMSFFGTGNIASISSFDPNIIRCFLTTFSPFLITGLVVLKLAVPLIVIITIILGMSEFARFHEREVFVCLLFICDLMGLNFLFLVRNRGSWLEIGSSISHFAIIQVTTLVLVLITCCSKALLRLNRFTPIKAN